MILLPKIHQFANTEDTGDSVMFTLTDKSRLVLFSLDDAGQHFLRVFYADDCASYYIGSRKDMANVLEEDLHGVGEVCLEESHTSIATLKGWGFKALAKRFDTVSV